MVDTLNDTLYGANATVTCDEGYDITGYPLLTCTHAGWEGNASCVIQGKLLCMQFVFF